MGPVAVLSYTCFFAVERKLRRQRIWENTEEKVWQDSILDQQGHTWFQGFRDGGLSQSSISYNAI